MALFHRLVQLFVRLSVHAYHFLGPQRIPVIFLALATKTIVWLECGQGLLMLTLALSLNLGIRTFCSKLQAPSCIRQPLPTFGSGSSACNWNPAILIIS
jgi:hypothetical protein